VHIVAAKETMFSISNSMDNGPAIKGLEQAGRK
jgi:hypothetical protein